MKKISTVILLSIFLLQYTLACLPPSPHDIILGTFQWEYVADFPKNYFNTQTGNVQAKYLSLTNIEKPFTKQDLKGYTVSMYNPNIWKYFFYDVINNNTSIKFSLKKEDIKNLSKWDTIIALSFLINGRFSDYYSISSLWKLECKGKNLVIKNIGENKLNWEKETWQCGNYKPDNVLSKQELLAKLQQKYNFCKTPNSQPIYLNTKNKNIVKIVLELVNINSPLHFFIKKLYTKISLVKQREVKNMINITTNTTTTTTTGK